MKAIVYFSAALATASILFAATQPAYAAGASVRNSTPNAVLVEEFNARGLPSNIHLRPGQQRNLRADTRNIHAEMSLPGGRPWTQCGPMRPATGALRVVAVGQDRCRIQ
jgi:hypothetical protein